MNDWLDELERRAERGRRRPPETVIAEAIRKAGAIREARSIGTDSGASEFEVMDLDPADDDHAKVVQVRGLRHLLMAAAVVTVVAGGLGAAIRFQAPDSTMTAVLGESADTEESAALPDAEPDIDWRGVWTWTEFYDNGSGSYTELVHTLTLERRFDAGAAYEGWFEQRATNVEEPVDHRVPVVTRRSDHDDGSVEIISVDGESAEPYPLGTVLFGLSGDPEEPTTALINVATLVPTPVIAPEGVYFLPEQ